MERESERGLSENRLIKVSENKTKTAKVGLELKFSQIKVATSVWLQGKCAVDKVRIRREFRKKDM